MDNDVFVKYPPPRIGILYMIYRGKILAAFGHFVFTHENHVGQRGKWNVMKKFVIPCPFLAYEVILA